MEPVSIGQCAIALLIVVPIMRALYLFVSLKCKVLKCNNKK